VGRDGVRWEKAEEIARDREKKREERTDGYMYAYVCMCGIAANNSGRTQSTRDGRNYDKPNARAIRHNVFARSDTMSREFSYDSAASPQQASERAARRRLGTVSGRQPLVFKTKLIAKRPRLPR